MKKIKKTVVLVAITTLLILAGACYFLWRCRTHRLSENELVKHQIPEEMTEEELREIRRGINVDPLPRGEGEENLRKQFSPPSN